MAQQTTDDGITVSEIDATYKVLETIRENLSEDGMTNLSEIANEAHYLVQQYDEGANWGQNYSVPDVGETMMDPESDPRFGSGLVEIIDHANVPASDYQIDKPGRFTAENVAEANPGHPADAPVVKGQYVDGSDKVYAFPVTRLDEY